MNQVNTQALKVALVTGAARRVGAAIAKKLHQASYRIVIHCNHSLVEAQALAKDFNLQRPDSALVLQGDLCTPGIAEQLIKDSLGWAGRLDLLVNNASIFKRNGFDCFDEKIWDDLFASNVKAPFLLSLAARPYLAVNQGVIINLTDIHADRPLREYAIYCQSKAAFAMQTKALAREFAPEIRVNAVAPGSVAWPEQDNILNNAEQADIIAKTPLKRHGDPDFIAQAVLALASNPFITGQILNVDGGRSI